jgi:hypothetical protein
MLGRIANPNVIWYTDRSGINNHFDAGIYGPRDNQKENIPVGSLSTVFQAEVMAILRCRELLLFKNITRRTNICSDKRAAMAALAKITTKSALIWKSMQVLEKLSGSKKDTLVWTPRQHGIPGYEEAHKLAKERTNNEVPIDQTVGIPFVVGKEVIRRHLRQEHLNRCKTSKGCGQSTTIMNESLPSRTKELQAMSRQKLKAAVNMLTGHTTLRAHMFKLGLTKQQDYQLCGDGKEDSLHIECHCPALASKGSRTLSCMFLKT